MTPESLFQAGNTAALACWILLIFLPRYPILARLVIPVAGCGLFGVVYVYLVVTHAAGAEGGFGSLDGVARLFQDKQVLLAGWIHYLAFDLFIGCWQVRDARRHGISQMLIVPALLLTFLFGPAGLLVYYIIRVTQTHRIDLEEHPRADS
jgi:hypothetical protein